MSSYAKNELFFVLSNLERNELDILYVGEECTFFSGCSRKGWMAGVIGFRLVVIAEFITILII